MKYKTLIPTTFFVIMAFTAAGQSDAAWLKMITANAVSGKDRAHPGYALYFSQVGDLKVPYLVYVPQSYDPAKATPVVVFLHGAILARDSFHYKDPAIADEPIFSIGDTLKA